MNLRVFTFWLFSFSWVTAQYSPINAHSHNDYLQRLPFTLAHERGFGSIEADVFLKNDTLFVAHEYHEITSDRTFESLYLTPIIEVFKKNGGAIYKEKTRHLQLLIDLKTNYITTLPALVKMLDLHKKYFFPLGTVQIVISGSTPPASDFKKYPDYIFFDGRPEVNYASEDLERVALISQSFRKYSLWNGLGTPKEKDILKEVIERAHTQRKPFRFWASPDTPDAWQFLMDSKADFINTDKIEELVSFLEK